MIYTIHLASGEVTRVADGKVVAPCQSADDPDFVDYIHWAMVEGNQPDEVA